MIQPSFKHLNKISNKDLHDCETICTIEEFLDLKRKNVKITFISPRRPAVNSHNNFSEQWENSNNLDLTQLEERISVIRHAP